MRGSMIVVDAAVDDDRYGWLVSSEYVSSVLAVDSWGAAISQFAPPPTWLLLGDTATMSQAQLTSAVRISRALGVTVVCDTSIDDEGPRAAAIAAGAAAWDGSPERASEVFTRSRGRIPRS